MEMRQTINSGWNRLLIFLTVILVHGNLCHGQASREDMKINPYRFPLKVSSSGRYLVDQTDMPFFWSGEAAWSLIAQLSTQDAELYLDNRMSKGFTAIMVSLIEHKFCTNPPANYYGNLPFTGVPFKSPNEKYFAHADSVIESAARRNIVVLLAPLYLGYDCRDEGWCAELKNASLSDLRSWGQYLGVRYRKFSNIIWLIGGDTDPTPVKEKVLEVVKGIREYDTVHLISAHNQPESMAITPWTDGSWISVNNVYSYDSSLYRHYRTAYELKPILPYNQIESAYENEHNSTPGELRSYAYWAILSGAMGHTFGNCPVWHFGGAITWCKTNDWKKEMNNSGSVSMDYLQRLFRSRSWQTLIPDFENKLITSGYGKWGTKDHVAAAITSDGNTLIAYLPSKRAITVDVSGIHGKKARCWWYNPGNGDISEIGTFPNSGSLSFTPTTDGDWVFVIDNDSAELPVPGSKPLR